MPSSNSWPFKAYQPFRLIYQLCCTGAILARFPLWIIQYGLFRSLRPHPTWTFQQALMVQLIRAMIDITSKVGISDPLSLKPGAEKERFQILQPFSKDLYKGPLQSTVKPTTIGGTWYSHGSTGSNTGGQGPVILHIHGGAFVTGDGRNAHSGFLANTLLDNAGIEAVFAPQYRLSGYGNTNPFPAALQDVLTSYLYLLRTLNIPPQNITLSGDSAGGNLAIAFLRYLSEYGEELGIPNPQSAVLISPWVSPLNSLGADVTITSNPHFVTDFLPPSFIRWGARTYAAITPATDPYITPLGNPFATSVPIFINQGSVEILELDGTQWVKEMNRVEGNSIQSEYEVAAPHDTLLVGDKAGWRESAAQVATKVGQFIRVHHKSAGSEHDFENIPGRL